MSQSLEIEISCSPPAAPFPARIDSDGERDDPAAAADTPVSAIAVLRHRVSAHRSIRSLPPAQILLPSLVLSISISNKHSIALLQSVIRVSPRSFPRFELRSQWPPSLAGIGAISRQQGSRHRRRTPPHLHRRRREE